MHLRYDRAFGVERTHTPIMLAELTSLFRSGLLQSATMSDGDRHSRTDAGLGGTKVIETGSPWLSMARHFLPIEDRAARLPTTGGPIAKVPRLARPAVSALASPRNDGNPASKGRDSLC